MNGLKIGVLTFHRCINYGSYWQAKCLAEGLSAMGHHVTILDHDSRKINLAEWKCAFQPVLPQHVPTSDHPHYRKKIQRFFKAFDSLPLSARFNIEDPSQMEWFDTVVVGSDEVWNLFHPWYGKYPLFYGEGLQANRVISYAASFGNYDASWGLENYWAHKLENFSSISVRDENSKVIVRNATGIEPQVVLDPCLQFPIVNEKVTETPARPYVAVYGHNFSAAFYHEVKQWAKHRSLQLISIGYRNDWADEQLIAAGPHDFASLIAGADAVATNFFHGCVFALVNQKPFVCEASSYRSNKIQGLVQKIGAEQHLMNPGAQRQAYDERLGNPLDPQVFRNIEALRQSSAEYLHHALRVKQVECA